jgi:hypothetical protein
VRIAVAVAVATCVAACGGGGKRQADPLAEAASAYQAGCGARLTEWNRLRAECLKQNPAYLTAPGPSTSFDFCAEEAKSIAQGRATYDPSREAACTTAIRAFTCADFWPMFSGGIAPAACQGLLTGRASAGSSCRLTTDCLSGYCTSEWTFACPGTCQPEVGLGGDCQQAPCGAGLRCDYSNLAAPSCAVAGGAGEACPCAFDLWCDTSAGAPGTCRLLITTGPCDPQNSACGFGTRCDGGTCQPLPGPGESCSSALPCGQGYECRGTCQPWPRVGEPCTRKCLGGWCYVSPATNTGTCQAYLPLGAPCGSSVSEPACISGTCLPHGQLPQPNVCAQAFCSAP